MSELNRIVGILHTAGCPVPGYVDALPMATMTGRNPYLQSVADGHGGQVQRCAVCGMIEGDLFVAPDSTPEPTPEPTHSSHTAAASAARKRAGDDHRRRARELRCQDLSAAQIGIRMATEEGRADRPYDSRQVWKWLEQPEKE